MDHKGDTHSAKEPHGKSRLQTITKELAESDPIIIRALEDLMMVLLNKNVIGVDEIHPMVVETIIHRRKLRNEMKNLEADLT